MSVLFNVWLWNVYFGVTWKSVTEEETSKCFGAGTSLIPHRHHFVGVCCGCLAFWFVVSVTCDFVCVLLFRALFDFISVFTSYYVPLFFFRYVCHSVVDAVFTEHILDRTHREVEPAALFVCTLRLGCRP